MWQHSRRWGVLLVTLFGCQTVAADDAFIARKTAMAVETVQLAQSLCDYDVMPLAERLIEQDRVRDRQHFAGERAVVADLWRETWRCNAAIVGDSCMAARWQLCNQAYAEYGPDGIRMKGLIRAIIKK